MARWCSGSRPACGRTEANVFRPGRILTINEARQRTSRILPRALYEYIEGGTEDETTLAENENAFRSLTLRPRMGVDVEPDLATTVLGSPLSMPLLLAPAGMVQIVHPDGAAGVARAAA